jgi:hypothetical protein
MFRRRRSLFLFLVVLVFALSAQSAAAGRARLRAPVNTAPPRITGSAVVGGTVTASTGTWSGSGLKFRYTWKSCDTSGNNCTAIFAATASHYTVTSADVGSTLRVSVKATNKYGSATATSAPTAVVTAVADPPSVSSPPSISGTTKEGQTLTAQAGSWSGAQPQSYSYQWQHCDTSGGNCTPTSTTSTSYTLGFGDVGSTMRIAVTATNTDGSATADSSSTAAVAPLNPPVNNTPPTIAGSTEQGQTLSAEIGSWSGAQPQSYSYQWQRCDSDGNNCASVFGAIASTYTLGLTDVGSTFRIAVTATNVDGTATANSAPTANVAFTSSPPSNSALPTVTGTAKEGQTLTAQNGSWSGAQPQSYSYEWQRCDASGNNCAFLNGALASSYTLGFGDVGSTLRVTVTATNTDGTASASSTATAVVIALNPPSPSSLPMVTGTAKQGQTLTAQNGSWSGLQPQSYSYSWKR